MLELLIVLAVIISVSAIAYPQLVSFANDMRLRAAAGDIAGLMQQARILAAKNNTIFPVRQSGQQVYIDCGGCLAGGGSAYAPTGSYTNNDPVVELPQNISWVTTGSPGGTNGAPSNYVLSGDGCTSCTNNVYDNTNTIAFSARGLPCNYASGPPPTCTTPANGYFVFYLETSSGSNWGAVLVTQAARSKALTWNGTAWH